MYVVVVVTRPVMNINQVLCAIDGLSLRGCYKVHYHVGERINRRMFYQLTFDAPWANNTLFCDHTDRFYEVCDQLANLIVTSLNFAHVDPNTLPDSLFYTTKDGGTVGDIKEDYRDEYTLVNIMDTYLDRRTHKFNIEHFEVSF